MQNPLVSIIIPTYNNAHFFHRLFESLLNQDYTNWEAIIIDNFSGDDTLSIIEEYNDNRVFVYQIHNRGIIAKSRNLGIKKAKGDLIAFLDSDDWWDFNKLSYCVPYFNKGIDIVYHKLEIKIPGISRSKKYLYSKKFSNNLHKDLLINGNFIPNSSVIIKRDVLENVGYINEHEQMVGSEDFNLWLRVGLKTNKALYLNKRLGYYYIDGNGVSSKNMTFSYEFAIKEFIINCDQYEKKKIESHLAYMKARFAMKLQDSNNVRPLLKYSILNGTARIKFKSLLYLLQHLIFIK